MLTLGFGETLLALFLTAGYVKADPSLAWIPGDLTVILAAALTIVLVRSFIRDHGRVSVVSIEVLLLFALMLAGVFNMDWQAYGSEKLDRFYTLTLLAAIAPMFLVLQEQQLVRFFNALTVLGLGMSAAALATLISNPSHLLRVTAFGSNTIALGRAAGAAAVWLVILNSQKRLASPLATVLLLILGVALVASGSRGPLIATVVAATAVYLSPGEQRYARTLRVVAFACVLLGMITAERAALPQGSLDRIESLLAGQPGESASDRAEALRASLARIPSAPLGIGFGGFTTKINLWPGSDRQYPHNIIIEILLETGWAAGLYFIWLVILGFRRLLHARWQSHGRFGSDALLGFLIFSLMNALVSGDINDNRLLFTILALALSYQSP